MFYKLMHKRSYKKYKKSYFNILCIFIISLTMFSFTNIYNDSYLNYIDAVLIPSITQDHTCDIRIINLSESHKKLFEHIPYLEIKHIDGNLDFFLTDTDKFEMVYHDIEVVHQGIKDSYSGTLEDFPSIYTYYGEDPTKYFSDYHTNQTETKLGILLFQAILSVIGISAMILIYSDYIEQRTEDIRTLSGIGISEQQLHRLFFTECNVLYIISLVIGIPLGAFIAYLYFKGCEFVDLSNSNSIFPVFHVDIVSLFMTVFVGYLVVYITFTVVLKRILSIDASYTCMEKIIDFNPDKSRSLYYKSTGEFDKFFLTIMRRRSPVQFKYQFILVIYSIVISIFMLNAINYEFTSGITKYGMNSATIVESIANASLYIMVGVFSIIFSLVIVWIFTKRFTESYTTALQTLYSIGANERDVYSCFYKHTLRNIVLTLIFGYGIGYIVTIFIFDASKYTFNMNLLYLLCNLLIGVIYLFVYYISSKKYIRKNCCSLIIM